MQRRCIDWLGLTFQPIGLRRPVRFEGFSSDQRRRGYYSNDSVSRSLEGFGRRRTPGTRQVEAGGRGLKGSPAGGRTSPAILETRSRPRPVPKSGRLSQETPDISPRVEAFQWQSSIFLWIRRRRRGPRRIILSFVGLFSELCRAACRRRRRPPELSAGHPETTRQRETQDGNLSLQKRLPAGRRRRAEPDHSLRSGMYAY